MYLAYAKFDGVGDLYDGSPRFVPGTSNNKVFLMTSFFVAINCSAIMYLEVYEV